MKKIHVKRLLIGSVIIVLFVAGMIVELNARRRPQPPAQPPSADAAPLVHPATELRDDIIRDLSQASVRLPLAAALGAVLALRRRRGVGLTEGRSLVVQTQIVLAIVGALIMLVVGASLARAFGIVGVASLIRYRSKIGDPKEAGVMLSALAVGLACGTGLYALAIFGTAFLACILSLIESFEPKTRVFDLTVKGEGMVDLRPRIEAVLRRYKTAFELRASSDAEAQYHVTTPEDVSTVRVTEAVAALWPEGKASVEWNEDTKSGAV